MELLFKRKQTSGKLTRVSFKLWGKVELDADEDEIVRRYRFDQAVLIEAIEPELARRATFVGFVVFALVFGFIYLIGNTWMGFLAGAIAGSVSGYWYLHNNRETVFVKDLLHGRHFTCDSVVDLARKEAWLTLITEYLRQVMESAKHWDGTEYRHIRPLPKEEAREVIIRGL